MIIKYLTFSISITFISWVVGLILNLIFMKTQHYQKFSNLNFIENKSLNKNIGLGIIKWVVKNTPFKFFNPKLKLKSKVEMTDLDTLRKEMTSAEIGHLIAFVFVMIFALKELVHLNFVFALIIMIVNTLMNLYPSLLQQENKRRIDKLAKLKYS